MANHKETELDSIFHALADGTRRDMLARLAVEDHPPLDNAAAQIEFYRQFWSHQLEALERRVRHFTQNSRKDGKKES